MLEVLGYLQGALRLRYVVAMRWPPRRVVTVSSAVAATLPGDALLYAVLPVIWADLGLELWMVGWLLSANRFVRLGTNPLAGRVVGRVGVHRPFVAAVFATALVTAAYGLDAGFAVFLGARLLWGLLWSFLRLGGFLAALAAPEGDRGFALGFYNGVANAGTLLAMALGGLLTDQLGFRQTVLAFAALTLPAGLAMLREGLHGRGSAPDRPRDEAAPADPAMPPARRRWGVYGAAFVTGTVGSPLVLATLGLWLSQLHGQTVELGRFVVGVATLNGALLGVSIALALPWAPAAGRLSDRFGRIPFAASVGVAAAGGMLGLSLPGGLAWTVTMALIVFLAGIALRVSCDTLAGDAALPAAQARFMSWYANAGDLGSAAAPFLAYPLAAAFGIEWVYRGGAACLCLAGLVVLLMLRPEPRAG